MRSEVFWSSAVQWARVGVGGVVFLVAARSLPVEAIGAFGIAAAPLRFVQVIHKGGIEDAAVVTDPDDAPALAALQRVSVLAGLGAAGLAALAAPAMGALGEGVGGLALALAVVPVAHGLGAVADGRLRREGRFRALALRTLAGQLMAAGIAFWALAHGAGVWALVLFTLVQAAIATAIAVAMAGWTYGPAGRVALRAAALRVWPLALRVMVGGLVQPVLQVAIGTAAGLAVAGVWQIAVRVIGLLEALTVVPLRSVALPRLARGGAAEVPALMWAAGLAGVWVMGGTALAAPALVGALLGPGGVEVVPVLQMLCLGTVAGGGVAVLNQALIGAGRSDEALRVGVIAAIAALLAGTVTLAVWPGGTALALSQVAAGWVALMLLLRAADVGIGAVLRPWGAWLTMAPAVLGAGWLASGAGDWIKLGVQVLAGSAALGATLWWSRQWRAR